MPGKKKYNYSGLNQIRIVGIPDHLKGKIVRICKAKGVTPSAMLKPIIYDWILTQPEPVFFKED
jgi:hypothetical protein